MRTPADPDVLADVRYRGIPENARLVRNLIGSTADLYGADTEAVDDLRMCVSEAFNNVAVHATGAIARVRLLIDRTNDRWVVEVADDGSGAIRLPTRRADPVVADEEPEGGFGLHVIRATADETAVMCGAGGKVLAFAVSGLAEPTCEFGKPTEQNLAACGTPTRTPPPVRSAREGWGQGLGDMAPGQARTASTNSTTVPTSHHFRGLTPTKTILTPPPRRIRGSGNDAQAEALKW
jgi:anti-sigma regulatory factor (Ser/Thr protein kinase)